MEDIKSRFWWVIQEVKGSKGRKRRLCGYWRGQRGGKVQKHKNKNHHLERQSMTRLGDGRDFASGVAQNSHPEGALMRPL